MATSWLIVNRDGTRSIVDLRTLTRQGVLAAVRRTRKAGADVVAGYQGGPWPIALSPKVYPRPA